MSIEYAERAKLFHEFDKFDDNPWSIKLSLNLGNNIMNFEIHVNDLSSSIENDIIISLDWYWNLFILNEGDSSRQGQDTLFSC